MTKEQILAKIAVVLQALKKQIFMPESNMLMTIYEVAKGSLGQHLTLDPSVPPEVGCAEAVSTVLKKAGIQGIPAEGIAGTNPLYQWLNASPAFIETTTAVDGAVIVSPSTLNPDGTIKVHGHIGICGTYGVMSNESDNGLWAEKFSYQTWDAYYCQTLGLPVYFFRAL